MIKETIKKINPVKGEWIYNKSWSGVRIIFHTDETILGQRENYFFITHAGLDEDIREFWGEEKIVYFSSQNYEEKLALAVRNFLLAEFGRDELGREILELVLK